MAIRSMLAGAALVSSAVASYIQVNPISITGATNTPANTAEATLATPTPSSLGGSNSSQYRPNSWVPFGQGLRPKLSQWDTNGHSVWGTRNASKLSPFLDGPMPQGFPWGSRNSRDTNYYSDVPETGVTRHYDFTVSRKTIAPDGVEVSGLVVNDQYPGPLIEANWGDWIEVIVHNTIDDEGTSLHWHGLLQTATPWMDGVPGVQQCPIAPGSSFTYRFKADLYGTSWYHSHYSAQYAAGLVGPMVIHGPKNYNYDVDLGPVMLSDWYHRDYFSILEEVMAPVVDNAPLPLSNNNLINGKMNFPCDAATGVKCTPNAGLSKFFFESGKSYRLRLINSGAEGMQKFSIDGYKLLIIAQDYVEVNPYEVDVVTLFIGQRTDIIVKATGKPTDAVWMRTTLGPGVFKGGCTLTDGVSPEAVAAIYYESANTTALPTTTSSAPQGEILNCANDALTATTPFKSLTPDPNPEIVQQMDLTFGSNGTHNLFYINNQTFRTDYNDPILLDAKLGQDNFPSIYNVYNTGNAKSVRIVFVNHNSLTGVHPMHLHGHNMYILASGTGAWDGTVTNPSNPIRRDVVALPNAPSSTEPSYLVVQYDAVNPGAWPFHCHIAWHVSAGLYVNMLELPDQIEQRMQIPSVMAQTCRDWSAWTGSHIPEQIDSGL